jgi:hypothetical protein
LYTAAAVWIQYFWPGIDFFTPGLLVCLQEKKGKTVLILAGLWMLFIEGSGSVAFGSQLLYLAGLFVFFRAGSVVFEPENPFFVILLSLVLAVWRFLAGWLMLSLQDLAFSLSALASYIPGQWAATVFVWGLTFLLYKRFVHRP